MASINGEPTPELIDALKTMVDLAYQKSMNQEYKSPEEILMKNAPGWLKKLVPEAKQDFIEAMQEYADQEMVRFGQWLIDGEGLLWDIRDQLNLFKQQNK